MTQQQKRAAWERIETAAAREFCRAYASAHNARVDALAGELGDSFGASRLDLTEASLIKIWEHVLAHESLPAPVFYLDPHTKTERVDIQPGLTTWYGLAPEPTHPDPEHPLSFPGFGLISLHQARLGSFIAAYVVEMLSEVHADVAWEIHTKNQYAAEKLPSFGSIASPEQAIQVLLYSALEGKTAWSDGDALLIWYLDCLDVLEDSTSLASILAPFDESEIEITQTAEGEFTVEFDDVFAHERSGHVERITRHLGRAEGIDWAERTDREVVLVATSLDLVPVRNIVQRLRRSTSWPSPQPRLLLTA